MENAVPAGLAGTSCRARTDNILSFDTKNMRDVLTVIHLEGTISEIQLFDLFENRKIAISFISRMMTGRNRAFDTYLSGGLRYYKFSEHFLKKQADLEASL